MNRILTSVAAMALGLDLCGTAQADARNDYRFDRFERDRNTDRDQDHLRHFDDWWLRFDWKALRFFDDWRLRFDWYDMPQPFDFDPDDLRHFDIRWVKHVTGQEFLTALEERRGSLGKHSEIRR